MSVCHLLNLKISQTNSLFVVIYVIVFEINLVSMSDGICAEELGYSVNNFLDKCFQSHYYFSTMREYNLKNLFKISCCPGYRKISRIDRELRCSPICSTPCASGTCIKPETCGCKVGYFLKSQYVCSPVCNPSCVNGICSELDNCVCYPGYRKLNNSKNQCEPICEKSCINGFCTAPGVCKCNEGYKFELGSSNKCEPYCENECINSVCTQPDACDCFVGHKKLTPNICEPVCSYGCGVGTCLKPEICFCPPGYKDVELKGCKPICRGCRGGTCVAPNVCYCPAGQTLNNTVGDCEQICSPPCINGKCLAPGKCVCQEGHEITQESHICKPICELDCTNGHCIGYNKCECHSGYKLNALSQFMCDPICSSPCHNGVCIAPETCQCSTGYVEIIKNVCAPLCLKGCEPGTCIAPFTCECPDGYQNVEDGSCKPVCSPPCDRGFCIAPDVCICSDGYSWDEISKRCISTCQDPCVNGICISPNECACLKGYEKASETHCYPTCSQNCSNGVCTSPDVCSCLSGFNKHPEEWYSCLPELGTQTIITEPFLNTYKLSSSIRYLEDNETFFFTDLPVFTIKKDCSIIPWTNIYNNVSEYVQIKCTLITDYPELEIFCVWPVNGSDLSNTNWKNDSLENSTLIELDKRWDFKLDILFLEPLFEVEDGKCSLCIQPWIQERYFTLSSIENLILKPCDEDKLEGMNVKGQAIEWMAFNPLYGISLLLLAAAFIAVLILRFWWHKSEQAKNGIKNDVSLEALEKANLADRSEHLGKKGLKQSVHSSDCESHPIIQASDL